MPDFLWDTVYSVQLYSKICLLIFIHARGTNMFSVHADAATATCESSSSSDIDEDTDSSSDGRATGE